MALVDKLRGFRVLDGFTLQQLAALSADGDELEAKAGDVIFRENDEARELVFLFDGKFEVKSNGAVISEVPPCSMVGEMGVLRNEPRVATVTATTASHYLSLSREDFFRVTEEDPEIGRKFYRNLSLILMEQLKKNNLLVEFYSALGQ